jgi:hypothetical protein
MFNLIQCELFHFKKNKIMFIFFHDMNNLVFIYVIIFVFGWNYHLESHHSFHNLNIFIVLKIMENFILVNF